MTKLENIAQSIRKLHEIIRDELVTACETTSREKLVNVDYETEEDTIYAIDRISERRIVEFFENQIASIAPVVLIAEGIGETGKIILPADSTEAKAEFRIILDPIDGTRELMYQKRSAWILTGVAPNKGSETSLQDIKFAIQTEIPLIKQHLSDIIWAFRGEGAKAQQYNRLTGENHPLGLRPSSANTIAHGFAMIARFFPGARDVLAAIDEEVVRNILGDILPGKALCFEDQYLSSGGQLYELMSGHDRFVADLRPLLENVLAQRGLSLGLCCHPYDLCTELIAKECGVIVTDPNGNPVNVRLNVTDSVAWIGYANQTIRQQVEPHLRSAMEKYLK